MDTPTDGRCDECEKLRKDIVICTTCIETLCAECDLKVHNKGTRVRHVRVSRKMGFYEDRYNKDFVISYFAYQCYRSNLHLKKSADDEIRKLTYDKLLELTKKGYPMILMEDLVDYLEKNLDHPRGVIFDALSKELQGSLFHQTIRTFGDYEPKKYFSLYLNNISLEAIIWIILSIKNDMMQPTETLVHSRFKECFAIKISMKEWKAFVENLASNEKLQKKMNAFENILGRVIVKMDDDSNTAIFTLKDEKWEYEDLQDIKDDNKDYIIFLNFIEDFFSEKSSTKTSSISTKNKDSGIKKYLSSVKNSHVNQSLNSVDANLKKILQNKSIKKAIPGGKYGCALMLKICGPDELRCLSLGRISTLIKHALKNQVLIHYKTLIIKNEKSFSKSSSERDNKIFEIQRNIIELLKESEGQSLTLAQLPLRLQSKYKKIFNFPDLGFPKLKNFLATMEDYLELVRSANNHITVRLKDSNEVKSTTDNKIYTDDLKSPNSVNDFSNYGDRYFERYDRKHGFKTLQPNAFDQKCKQIETIGNQHIGEHKKSFSNLQQYLSRIKFFVIDILKRNTFGIEMTRLEENLSKYLGTKFDPRIFKADDFKEFLLNNFDEYVDIEVKKNIRITTKKQERLNSKLTSYIVYPKSYSKMVPTNFSRYYKSTQDEFCHYSGILDADLSDLQSNRMNTYNKISQANDSFSDSSLYGIQNNLNSETQVARPNHPDDNKKDDSKYFNGFEFQVISPIPSLSTTQINNDDREAENEDKKTDLDVTGLKFIKFLIDEN